MSYGYGAGETAQARAIRSQNDRHVTGKIDRADGVRGIVDIGRMQTGFAAVAARPLRFWAEQAYTGAAGIVMHFPIRAEERFDIRGGEEVGRSVRAV